MTELPPEDFKPTTEKELLLCMQNPWWRLCNLYYITIKEDENDEEEEGRIVLFKPNDSQRDLLQNIHYRNVVPKARQRGITTIACIYGLDYAVFTKNINAAIIAHKLEDAKRFFSDKVLFAFNRLPEFVLDNIKKEKKTQNELKLSNGSSIVVSTSLRSGTPQFLHISEYGKICAKQPEKAKEIQTGSFPAVPKKGIVIIESTAEGIGGDFHAKTMRALQHQQQNKQLTIRDYKLHFYSWWDADEYQMDPRGVILTAEDHKYFDDLEKELGIKISNERRAWYCATRDEDFSGDKYMMMQEYPSTVEEAFQMSMEGCYYTSQLRRAREDGRIGLFPILDLPIYTAWDLGKNDTTVIWFYQKQGPWDTFIGYYENNGEGLSHYSHYCAEWARKNELTYARFNLPHDVKVSDLSVDASKTRKEILETQGVKPIHVVPKVGDVMDGIEQTRQYFKKVRFDEVACKEGITHLASYRKQWDEKLATYKDRPLHDEASNAADAFRTAAMSDGVEMDTSALAKRRRTRSARTA